MPTVRDMLIDFLRERMYDGLYNAALECGCELADLCPCDEPEINDCKAGVFVQGNLPEGAHESRSLLGPREEEDEEG